LEEKRTKRRKSRSAGYFIFPITSIIPGKEERYLKVREIITRKATLKKETPRERRRERT